MVNFKGSFEFEENKVSTYHNQTLDVDGISYRRDSNRIGIVEMLMASADIPVLIFPDFP